MDDYSPDKILTELNNEIYVIMRNSSIEIEITCEKISVVNMTNNTEGKIQILIDQTLIDDNKGICNSYYPGIEKRKHFVNQDHLMLVSIVIILLVQPLLMLLVK